MNKHEKMERKLQAIYTDLSPQQIRKLVRIKLKEKINYINSNNNNEEHQSKVLATSLNKNPFAYLLGYVDTLEELVSEQNPNLMAEIVMDPQVKADLSRIFGKKLTTVIFTLAGAVDSIDILKLIDTARDSKFITEKIFQELENLVEDAINRDKE